jgi:hypothetical protein
VGLSYDTLRGLIYYLETATNIDSPDWAVLQTNLGDGSRHFFTNSIEGAIERYFRLRAQ